MANTSYKIAEFEIQGKQEKGGIHTIKDQLVTHLSQARVTGMQVKLEEHSVSVYGDPVISVLEEFERKSQSGGRLPVKLKLYAPEIVAGHGYSPKIRTLRIKYRDLQKEADQLKISNQELQQNVEDLQAKVTSYEGELNGKGQQISTLEDQHLRLLEDYDATRRQLLQVSATPETLETVLHQNVASFQSMQQHLRTSVFTQISEELESRAWYASQELMGAREVVAGKEKYLQLHGENAVKDIPDEPSREALLKKWEGAEQVIKEYETKVKVLKFPIQITKVDDGAVITIPVNSSSTNEIPKTLYETLQTCGTKIQSEYGLRVNPIQQQFATLKLVGDVDYQGIEAKLIQALGDVADRAGLKPYIHRIDYSVSHPEEARPKFQVTTINVGQFLRSKILERYSSLKDFCDKTDFPYGTLVGYTSNRDRVPSDKNIRGLAKRLNIKPGELRKEIRRIRKSMMNT